MVRGEDILCNLTGFVLCLGKQLALVKTNSAVRTCGFDFGGNIIMFSTDKQMGYQCFVSFFDLRDPSQIGKEFRQIPAWKTGTVGKLGSPANQSFV